jgi:hypothetical protein
LLDIWKPKFPHLAEPATYIRGPKRIDYTLISWDLSSAVGAVGYEPFHFTSPTDHRGIYIDFNTDQLFGNTTNKLKNSKSRHLSSKYPLGRKTYVQTAAEHGREQNLFDRLQRLIDSNERDDELMERLDASMTECCALGERNCKKTRSEWWTLEVNRLRIWRRILQKLQSSYKNGINIHARLTKASAQSCIDKPLPVTAEATTIAIAQVRKDIRACLKKSNETRALEQLERIAMC